jgi:hypothetical protein
MEYLPTRPSLMFTSKPVAYQEPNFGPIGHVLPSMAIIYY